MKMAKCAQYELVQYLQLYGCTARAGWLGSEDPLNSCRIASRARTLVDAGHTHAKEFPKVGQRSAARG